ncbi:hypothetical protein Hdeb2414_s0006g00198881 [Helianthus debilis subsp. tardiflorus]
MMTEKIFLVEPRDELYSEGLRLQRYKVKQWRWRFNFRKADGLQDFEEPKDARMHDKQSGNLLKKSRCLQEQMMNYKMEVIWWNKEYDGDVRLYGSGVTKK